MDIDPNKAVDEILKNRNKFAKAKAERVYLEEFRKSKKAILFQQAPSGTMAEKEAYAYSHNDYLLLLDGLKEAVEVEESLRWMLTAAQARIEIWRTNSANNRALDGATR
jgi:hypothetical protein